MRKKICEKWFKQCIKKYSSAKGNEIVVNPAISFVKNAKAGQYDFLDDNDYSDALDETEWFNTLMNDTASSTVNEVFVGSLMRLKLRDETIDKIATILADEYAHNCSDFTEELNYPENIDNCFKE